MKDIKGVPVTEHMDESVHEIMSFVCTEFLSDDIKNIKVEQLDDEFNEETDHIKNEIEEVLIESTTAADQDDMDSSSQIDPLLQQPLRKEDLQTTDSARRGRGFRRKYTKNIAVHQSQVSSSVLPKVPTPPTKRKIAESTTRNNPKLINSNTTAQQSNEDVDAQNEEISNILNMSPKAGSASQKHQDSITSPSKRFRSDPQQLHSDRKVFFGNISPPASIICSPQVPWRVSGQKSNENSKQDQIFNKSSHGIHSVNENKGHNSPLNTYSTSNSGTGDSGVSKPTGVLKDSEKLDLILKISIENRKYIMSNNAKLAEIAKEIQKLKKDVGACTKRSLKLAVSDVFKNCPIDSIINFNMLEESLKDESYKLAWVSELTRFVNKDDLHESIRACLNKILTLEMRARFTLLVQSTKDSSKLVFGETKTAESLKLAVYQKMNTTDAAINTEIGYFLRRAPEFVRKRSEKSNKTKTKKVHSPKKTLPPKKKSPKQHTSVRKKSKDMSDKGAGPSNGNSQRLSARAPTTVSYKPPVVTSSDQFEPSDGDDEESDNDDDVRFGLLAASGDIVDSEYSD